MDLKFLLIFSIPFIAGLITLIIGINYRTNFAYKTKNWQFAQGQVVDMKLSYRAGKRIYIPIILYQPNQTKQVTFEGHGSRVSDYETNQFVDIIYNPNNFQKAYIKDDKGRFTVSIVYLILGMILLSQTFSFLFFGLLGGNNLEKILKFIHST